MVKDRLTKFSNFQIFGFLVAIKMFKSFKIIKSGENTFNQE